MMLISLDLIKPSPNPVRTQWDEEKMNELVLSIEEQGLVIPIKVRPVQEWIDNCFSMQDKRWPMFCDERRQQALEKYGQEGTNYGTEPGLCGWCSYVEDKSIRPDVDWNEAYDIPLDWKPYEIVYGHRRVEACKRAGLGEIEAIVDGVDDTEAFLQALLENIQRDDLSRQEEANAVEALQKLTGWSLREIARQGFWPLRHLTRLSEFQKMPENIRGMVGKNTDNREDKPLTLRHIDNTRIAGDHGHREAVLEKAAEENLSLPQTEQVAKAIKEAPSEQAKEKLLEWEFSPHIHNPELVKARAETYGAHDPLYQEDKPSPQQQWDKVPEVKMMVSGLSDTILAFVSLLKEIRKTSKIEGKLAPEARQYMATKLRSFRDQINDLLLELEN